jgi:thiosulfate/3-mercaptopyruvate sulfurtransferase
MMGAARAAVAMLYAGVDDVRLLDGGLPAWRAAASTSRTTPRAPVAVAAFGGRGAAAAPTRRRQGRRPPH